MTPSRAATAPRAPGTATRRTSARDALRSLAALHEACADSHRLQLLNLLGAGELCVCDLVDLTGQSQPFVSRHLARLRAAGLVEVERHGKFAYYRLAGDGLPAPVAASLQALVSGLAAVPALREERAGARATVSRRKAAPCE